MPSVAEAIFMVETSPDGPTSADRAQYEAMPIQHDAMSVRFTLLLTEHRRFGLTPVNAIKSAYG